MFLNKPPKVSEILSNWNLLDYGIQTIYYLPYQCVPNLQCIICSQFNYGLRGCEGGGGGGGGLVHITKTSFLSP